MDVDQTRPISAANRDSYGTAQFLRHCLNLLNHAGAASDTANQLVAEVQSWGLSLDKSVAASRDELKAADQTIAELVKQVKGRVGQTESNVGQGLERVVGLLSERAHELQNVLSGITKIGNTVRMLALNATIERGARGEAGRGFAVVSQEVRALAQDTLKSADEAASAVQLTELQGELGKLADLTRDALANVSRAVEETNGRLHEAFSRTAAEVDTMAENNRVLREVLGGIRTASERARAKDEWVRTLLMQAITAWGDGNPQAAFAQLLQVEAVKADPAFDRLAEVKQRGSVRIAVEPDFKGLSFRGRPAPSPASTSNMPRRSASGSASRSNSCRNPGTCARSCCMPAASGAKRSATWCGAPCRPTRAGSASPIPSPTPICATRWRGGSAMLASAASATSRARCWAASTIPRPSRPWRRPACAGPPTWTSPAAR
jgi:ABC-type transporter Mla subunit MlaD